MTAHRKCSKRISCYYYFIALLLFYRNYLLNVCLLLECAHSEGKDYVLFRCHIVDTGSSA